MCFSNDNTHWSAWQAYATTAAWTLTAGDGWKTVYARLMDNAGNTTTGNIEATIILDTTPPTGGSVTIDSGAAYCNSTSATLTISAADSGSGVGEMSFSNDNINWSSWQAYATTAAWTLTTGDGTKTVYARFQDNAGNATTGNINATIIIDTTPPTGGGVTINSGAAYCASTSVTLTLSPATDSSGMGEMRFSNNDSTWSSWQTYATTAAWTLSTGDGTKTVYVQFQDKAGNTTTGNITASILLDTTAPIAGTCTPPASVTTSTVTVPYSGASDAGSGLKNVALWYLYATAPGGTGTWTNSGVTSTGGSGSLTFTPSSGPGWYYFALVAQDNAGNTSAAPTGTGAGPTICKLAFSDGFETDNLTAGGWTTTGTCAVQGTYKNSGSYAASMKGSSGALTKAFSTVGYSNITVQYAREARGSSGSFIVEWSSNAGELLDYSGNRYRQQLELHDEDVEFRDGSRRSVGLRDSFPVKQLSKYFPTLIWTM